jgi:hypothetical protein
MMHYPVIPAKAGIQTKVGAPSLVGLDPCLRRGDELGRLS